MPEQNLSRLSEPEYEPKLACDILASFLESRDSRNGLEYDVLHNMIDVDRCHNLDHWVEAGDEGVGILFWSDRVTFRTRMEIIAKAMHTLDHNDDCSSHLCAQRKGMLRESALWRLAGRLMRTTVRLRERNEQRRIDSIRAQQEITKWKTLFDELRERVEEFVYLDKVVASTEDRRAKLLTDVHFTLLQIDGELTQSQNSPSQDVERVAGSPGDGVDMVEGGN